MALSPNLFALSLIFFTACLCSSAFDVSYDSRAITIDGERKLIISGSIHYPRSTPGMWGDLIHKAKDGGLNAVETYVFWNAHEPLRRQYDFSGNLDLVRFIKTIQDAGLYAILRIGPYVCAEWNYGGFPVWLHNMPGIDKFRTNNHVFMDEMKTFTTLIVNMMRNENLFASQGGPIIIAQIENEYGNVISKYGEAGKEYINWCAKMALDFKINIPWIMCQQHDAPENIINTCNGYYCHTFTPKANTPKIWTENWTGWFKDWGMKDPHRTAEDVAFAVARFYQLGGTVQNYYMYHGGTNFGRSSGGPYITTSYDYDAPLDEYGNLNQPKWGHLKQLHLVLRSMEKILTYGTVQQISYGKDSLKSTTVYNYEGKEACFLANSDDKDMVFELYGTKYTVPAWSVTILPDCYTEAYNTAKVNVQMCIMGKQDNEADDDINEPYGLKWKWTSEYMEHLHKGVIKGGDLIASRLLDQKLVTNDTSDYLWYLTSVDNFGAKTASLRVDTNGHVLHAFVNGKHVGSDYSRRGRGFTFEKHVKLHPGKNSISLLSITVGLTNYGEFFDNKKVGIEGPVELTATKVDNWTKTVDLSSNNWVYKVGMHGQTIGLHLENPRTNYLWRLTSLPTNRKFTWYKTTFKTPLGDDPVVVDLVGMGKGMAWVNGHNIGRYWTSFLAGEDGCTLTCDYRNSYGPSKCLTNCGKPSQRWYHVPRSYLREDGDNTLVLFEEMGGNPGLVKFQTVTVERACATPYEGSVLELSCQGHQVISQVKFASFGAPQGTCGSFRKGRCEAPNTRSVIEDACLGQKSCSLDVSEQKFGPTGCHGDTYKLAVEVVCGSTF